jgi:hypothetical protein
MRQQSVLGILLTENIGKIIWKRGLAYLILSVEEMLWSLCLLSIHIIASGHGVVAMVERSRGIELKT